MFITRDYYFSYSFPFMFQASFSVRPLLQRHSSCHQRTAPQCQLWRSVQDRGVHVGQSGGGPQACKLESPAMQGGGGGGGGGHVCNKWEGSCWKREMGV